MAGQTVQRYAIDQPHRRTSTQKAARKPGDQDLSIIRLLQVDASCQPGDIAATVGLSAAAVRRRISRLESDGTTWRAVVVPDPSSVGFPLTVLVEVTLTDDRSATVAAMHAIFRESSDIQQCCRVTGTVDFHLVLLVPSPEKYQRRAAWLLADNELVASFRTLVVLDRVKVTSAIPT